MTKSFSTPNTNTAPTCYLFTFLTNTNLYMLIWSIQRDLNTHIRYRIGFEPCKWPIWVFVHISITFLSHSNVQNSSCFIYFLKYWHPFVINYISSMIKEFNGFEGYLIKFYLVIFLSVLIHLLFFENCVKSSNAKIIKKAWNHQMRKF